MTDNVKTFWMKIFEDGARTVNKADPVQVAREMKTLRNEEDVEATESGIAFDTLGSLMMDDMGKPSHPINVGVSNICELVKNKKLYSLKLAVLKEICNQPHLTTSRVSGNKKRLSLRQLKNFLRVAHVFKSNVTWF